MVPLQRDGRGSIAERWSGFCFVLFAEVCSPCGWNTECCSCGKLDATSWRRMGEMRYSTVNLKVKVVPVQAMKVNRRSVVIAPVVLTPLNVELNPICHLLALLGAHHILHVSRIRVNRYRWVVSITPWSFSPLEKNVRTHWIGGMVGPRGGRVALG